MHQRLQWLGPLLGMSLFFLAPSRRNHPTMKNSSGPGHSRATAHRFSSHHAATRENGYVTRSPGFGPTVRPRAYANGQTKPSRPPA